LVPVLAVSRNRRPLQKFELADLDARVARCSFAAVNMT
jgi:hypothetical protein